MKKLIVIGIVMVMVMGLSVAASAAVDTDWQVYMSLNNGVWTAGTQSYGAAGTDVKVGVKPAESIVNGASFATSTIAVVRDMSSTGTGFGLTTNYKIPVEPRQEWTNIELWANGGYTSPVLKFMVWGLNIDANAPTIQLICTQAAEGSGFSVGQIVYDSIANSTKATPGYTKDLSQFIPLYKTGSAAGPIATFKLVATTVPEPGSMVALFSGLVGLVGFGIRRRK